MQGVAWDPLNTYIVTQSGDRSCKVFSKPFKADGKDALLESGAVGMRAGAGCNRPPTAAYKHIS